MNQNFEKVREYILDLGHSIVKENAEDGILVIDHESEGIKNLVLCCTDTVLVMEQYIFNASHADANTYKQLLMKNRDILHGAFVLDESGEGVIFRDTLQVENLDYNEVEATINSLALLLAEYSSKIIQFSKQ